MNISVTHPTIGSGPKANFYFVEIDGSRFFFSYETCIAFYDSSVDTGYLVIRENSWGPTTGEHLNEVCKDKTRRISSDEFEERLAQLHVSFS